ncbi:MAG: AEC family transporter [Lachnospiraceae bacterium]|nr:AEC family transporter [Lachnospiraceae bacterium]
MEQLFFSLNATIPIFLMMVIGYILKQIKMVDESFIKTLNKLNYTVTLPVLLFRDISQSDFFSVWDTKYVLFCFFVTLFCIIIIWIIAGFVFKDKSLLGEFVQASYRSSAAVMGIAFIQNIYGNSGMAPLMIIGTVPLYNVAAVLVLSFTGPEAKGLSKQALKKSLIGIITNPIILGIFIGMAASACGLGLPVILTKTVNNIASLATPLALIALGAGFEGRQAIKLIKPTMITTALKLVIQPIAFLPLAIALGFRNEMLVALLVMLGAPTTPSCYIMAKNLGHEGVLTSGVVVATTFLSSITLTIALFILKSMAVI